MQLLFWFTIAYIAFFAMLVQGRCISEKKAYILIVIIMIFMAAFRNQGGIGGDEYNYRLGSYGLIGTAFQWSDAAGLEGGNYVLQWTLANIFKFSQPYIIACTLITNIPIFTTIYKYSNNKLFSIFLYVASGAYITSTNISRQYMAVGVIFIAYIFVERKKVIGYIIMVLLASWFHSSAVVMLPMYFILTRPKITKLMPVYIIVAVVMMVYFERVAGFLIKNTVYEHYTSSLSAGNAMNPIRMAVNVLPVILILTERSKIEHENNNPYMFYNAIMMVMVIAIVSIAFKYAYRFSEYFSIGSYILLPQLPNIVEKRSRVLVVGAIIALYLLFGHINTGTGTEYHNILFEQLPYGTKYGARYLW